MGIPYEEIRKYYDASETREQGYIVKIQKLMQEVSDLKLILVNGQETEKRIIGR